MARSRGFTVIELMVTMAILAITLIISVLDMRLESRTSKLAVSLAEANQELTYLALHDSLTGLPNRTLLRDRLQQALLIGDRDKTSVALLIMDLDRFKDVNDTLGHHTGDELLQQVGVRLRSIVRASAREGSAASW